GRTSDPKQTEIVQGIFLKLYENNFIVEDTLTQPYCEHDKMFLADRYVKGICPHCAYDNAKGDQCECCGKLLNAVELKEPQCTVCEKTPVFKETHHLFLDLHKIRPELEKWIDKESRVGNWSHNALSITKGWLDQGLLKRCITRDLKWGIPVPLKGYEDKVFYVWFDAPIGYISITAAFMDNWEEWWLNPDEVDLYQFMGKDNIPFHTVIFPSTLIGTGQPWTMVRSISSTEYLNYEDAKFSKSAGTGVFGDHAKETGIDADLFRYYLLRNRPEKNDTQFYWMDFMEKVNGEIIANYANLVNRVLQFVHKFFDGIIPAFDAKNSGFLASIQFSSVLDEIKGNLEELELKKALLKVLEVCSIGNKHFQDSEPWALVKTDKEKTGLIIGELAGFTKDISILLWPYIPATVEKVFKTLNLSKDELSYDKIGNYEHIGNKPINQPEILFKKIEKKQAEELRDRFSGIKPDPAIEFGTLSLKVGKIIEITKHPEADRLYIEKVDMGNGEIRQIVSGLVKYYTEEELLDKKIIVAYNLKPAELKGTRSEGMLLAAETKNKKVVEVISPDCEIGEIITVNNSTPNTQEIDIDAFFSVPMTVENFTVRFRGIPLKAAGKEIKVEKVESGKVG
ncbi:MAG: methionine--tRNA ligase, partial [Spirochaetales bacterium]|nr:methionine--tRNA ligase [Spirochaetales bacterium]